jgi:5-hydroxyisourate hydrolase-like protein (transthyretin family)
MDGTREITAGNPSSAVAVNLDRATTAPEIDLPATRNRTRADGRKQHSTRPRSSIQLRE